MSQSDHTGAGGESSSNGFRVLGGRPLDCCPACKQRISLKFTMCTMSNT
jgi:hypothetical protein